MEFDLDLSCEILENTPVALQSLLGDLSESWVYNNEGGDTWSAYDVMGHLIHGENTDWIPRAKIILAQGPNVTFEAFDRFAQFEESKGKTIQNLLDEFAMLRALRLSELKSMKINKRQLRLKGIHPALGEVTLAQLLAAWVAHDLTHVAQVARVMARQYQQAVGPWADYMRVLKQV